MINIQKLQSVADIYISNYSNGSRINVNGKDFDFVKGATDTSYYAVCDGMKYLPALKLSKPIDQLLLKELHAVLNEQIPRLTASKAYQVKWKRFENIDLAYEGIMMFCDSEFNDDNIHICLDHMVYMKLNLNDGDIGISVKDENTVSEQRIARAVDALRNVYKAYLN